MSNLKQFHNTLINSDFKYGVTTAGNWSLGGDFRNLTNPVMWYHNGSTYALGYESNVYNNKVWIVKQTGLLVETAPVNEGTLLSEDLNHPTPLLHIDYITGYIYVIQNAYHVDEFIVLRSELPEDITSFIEVGRFDTDGSYLSTIDNTDTNSMWFVTREGDSSPADGYDQSILNVDLDNPSAYTELLVTDTDYSHTNVRHYPNGAYFTGTSDYRTIFINHRWDGTPISNYKVSIYLKKLTDNLIYKFDLTGSKDVSVDGVLTPLELETDYSLSGTDSDKSDYNQILDSWQIDDTIYIIARLGDNTYMKKYVIGSLTEVASIIMPYNFEWQTQVSKMYDTGQRFMLALENYDSAAELWTIEYDLTGLTFKKKLGGLPDGSYFGLPENLKDVDDKYLIIGRSKIGEAGVVPYYITTETYNN